IAFTTYSVVTKSTWYQVRRILANAPQLMQKSTTADLERWLRALVSGGMTSKALATVRANSSLKGLGLAVIGDALAELGESYIAIPILDEAIGAVRQRGDAGPVGEIVAARALTLCAEGLLKARVETEAIPITQEAIKLADDISLVSNQSRNLSVLGAILIDRGFIK